MCTARSTHDFKVYKHNLSPRTTTTTMYNPRVPPRRTPCAKRITQHWVELGPPAVPSRAVVWLSAPCPMPHADPPPAPCRLVRRWTYHMKNQSSWRTVDGTAMPAKRQASERARVGGGAARAVDEAEREAGEEAEVEARGVTEAAESVRRHEGSSSSSSCFPESAVRRTAYLFRLSLCFADLRDICGGGGGGWRGGWRHA